MKNIFALAAMMAATLTLSSCEKGTTEQGLPPAPQPAEGAQVTLSFAAPAASRAFGTGASEVWEKKVNTATIMVFDTPGKLVYRRDLSAAEISAIPATPIAMVVPGVKVGANCTFALVANRIVPTTVVTKALLGAEIESDIAAYNGTFANVTTKALRAGGFVMSASTTQAIASGVTAVSLTLKRVVAKVEVSCATTSKFATQYGAATLTFNKIVLGRAATKSALVILAGATQTPGSTATYTTEQASVGGKNLFYLYEQPAAAAGARVGVTIHATYDIDGNPATTGDRTDLTYETELTGKAGGEILRNGAYFFDAKIDGLTGADVNMTVTVADWETLVTQSDNMGK